METMNHGLTGSLLSLDDLFETPLFSEAGEDEFLHDLGSQEGITPQFQQQQCSVSGANSVDSNCSGLGEADASYLGSFEPASACIKPAYSSTFETTVLEGWQFPTKTSTTVLKPPVPQPMVDTSSRPDNTNSNVAVLAQIISAVQASQRQSPNDQQPNNALMSSSLPSNSFSTMKREHTACQPAAPFFQASNSPSSLPPLNADQQKTLHSIVALTQFGSTTEGKKVRRMLSNRESARRSRHRKQAHVQELEDKVTKIEAENISLRDALARASQQEATSLEEKSRLYSELATLRSKVSVLEHSSRSNSSTKNEQAKQGASHGSSAGGTFSLDSCCDSVPLKRSIVDLEAGFGCKRNRIDKIFV